MTDQTVAQFVAKLGLDEALKARLESANLAELLAIAREHNLNFGHADELYAHAKHAMELWGTAPGIAKPVSEPTPVISNFLAAAKANPDLKEKLESADLEELLSIADTYELDFGHADAIYASSKGEMEIW
jgi:hypothetical protein